MGDEPKKRDILRWILFAVVILVILGFLFPALGVRRSGGPAPRERATISSVRAALRQYYTEYGALPGGDAARILAVLQGQNERQIIFYEANTSFLNPKGELIDPWGMPYRFDLSDSKNPRVWSCGKNRRDDNGAEGSDDIVSWR